MRRPQSVPQPRRPRVNQPLGFLFSGALRPSYYYGRRHDYVYYPESWTDAASGTSYEKGYYDENGQYYSSVAFPENGKYENVVCKCPYCGSDTVLTLTTEEAAAHNLECPHCGGPMEIVSELDDYVNQSFTGNTHEYNSEKSLSAFRQPKKKKRPWGWIILAAVLGLALLGKTAEEAENGYNSYAPPEQQIHEIVQGDPYSAAGTDLFDFGSVIYLNEIGQGRYVIEDTGESGDKVLEWDAESDNYYDAATDCWLWYNTDMDPPVWQYWYEGISSDYGDYGWMEHDSTGWYIEASYENWIRLPAKYDASGLWYIE